MEKYDRQQKNISGKNEDKDNSVQAKHFSSEKGILHHESLPLSNCLFWSVDHAVIPSCCWPNGSLADSSRAVACEVFALLLSSIPASG